jgi:hypothetical protein
VHYRAYEVGNSGHYISARDIQAPHDQGALADATKFLDERDIEVWQAGRFVARVLAERREWLGRSRIRKYAAAD